MFPPLPTPHIPHPHTAVQTAGEHERTDSRGVELGHSCLGEVEEGGREGGRERERENSREKAKETNIPNPTVIYTLRLLLFTGTNLADFEIVDLAGINFSDFAITCSINSKMCDKF